MAIIMQSNRCATDSASRKWWCSSVTVFILKWTCHSWTLTSFTSGTERDLAIFIVEVTSKHQYLDSTIVSKEWSAKFLVLIFLILDDHQCVRIIMDAHDRNDSFCSSCHMSCRWRTVHSTNLFISGALTVVTSGNGFSLDFLVPYLKRKSPLEAIIAVRRYFNGVQRCNGANFFKIA